MDLSNDFIVENQIGRVRRGSDNCQKSLNTSDAVLSYASFSYGVPEALSEQSHHLRALGGYCGSTYCSSVSCCIAATNPCCTLQPGTGTCCPDGCYDVSNVDCCGTYACIPGYYCCGSDDCCLLESDAPTESPTRNPTVLPSTSVPTTRMPTFRPSTSVPTTRMPTFRPSTIAPSFHIPTRSPTTSFPSYAPNSVRPPTPSSGAPTIAYSLNTWITCPYFSTSATANATYNVVYCSFYQCSGETAIVSLCSSNGASCSGNTYLRIYNQTEFQVTSNDDYCGSCSYATFSTSLLGCRVYQIAQGCYDAGTCAGETVVFITKLPTASPTVLPSPQPSTAAPSALPSIVPTPQPTTLRPSLSPTTASPSMQPTTAPSFVPTSQPSSAPTSRPTSSQPTSQPTSSPSEFVFPEQYPPPINGGEIIAAVFGSIVGMALMTLLLYKKQYEEAVHIVMSVGDIVTDMMFVKQIKLRMDYLHEMISLYHTIHDTSTFAKELKITESIFVACMLVITAFFASNFIAAFGFGKPHFYFASIMQYGINQLNNDLQAYFVNPYKHHVSHIYSSDDDASNHVFLAFTNFFNIRRLEMVVQYRS
jgi:hypothetical protein